MTSQYPAGSLGAALAYTPVPLAFGTSGRRGRVVDLTQLEVYLNARAELDYLLARTPADGGIRSGQTFYCAHDLRPSSTRRVPAQGHRGALMQAVIAAARDAGLVPANLGAIPTPALTAFALARDAASMMITGSHIPFDRNGYKTNSARGELLKDDEAPIAVHVARWRARLLSQPLADSPFDAQGMFRAGDPPLPSPDDSGRNEYLARYLNFLPDGCLRGLRVLVYQHSAVGRDLLVDVLQALGAEAVPVGRSETFVPIDTEAIDDATLRDLEHMATEASRDGARFDALVSTDGDSDRPLLVGLEYDAASRPGARFFGGDLVGMVVASTLGADAVVVPISCNDGITRGGLAACLEPRTRIGSPYVIAGMAAAAARGRRRICGWEANGGFLTGSTLSHDGRSLSALPTRDAFLPILCLLQAMAARRVPLAALFAELPARFSRAGLLRQFPRDASLAILRGLGPESAPDCAAYFRPADGFDAVTGRDYTDGARLLFANGDVAHIRPSGNADELRIYAVADSQARADEIVRLAVAEPDGILRCLQAAFAPAA